MQQPGHQRQHLAPGQAGEAQIGGGHGLQDRQHPGKADQPPPLAGGPGLHETWVVTVLKPPGGVAPKRLHLGVRVGADVHLPVSGRDGQGSDAGQPLGVTVAAATRIKILEAARGVSLPRQVLLLKQFSAPGLDLNRLDLNRFCPGGHQPLTLAGSCHSTAPRPASWSAALA